MRTSFWGKQQGILRLLSENRDRADRTYRKAVLIVPAAPPTESFKLFHLRITVRSEFNHHFGPGIDALAASDAFAFIDRKTYFSFHFRTILKYPIATDMAMKRYRVNDTSLRSWRRTRQQPPGNAIIAHNEGVDLLPSNIELSGMEGCENGI